MRIALDGSDLAGARFEGPSVYAGELIPRLTTTLVERGHVVRTYLPGQPQGIALTGDVRVIPRELFWTQRVLARALRHEPPDVLFLPIQMVPLRRPKTMATVAVVHDLEFFRYPRTFTMKNLVLLHLFTRHAARNATRLITVSQYTKDDVIRTYGRRASEITVVHHGVALPAAVGTGERLRKRFGLPARFLLFVGSFQPRKNIPRLLEAYEHLAADDAGAPGLVLVGGGGWKENHIVDRIRFSPRAARIHVLRRVSREELAGLYREAEVFIFPSLSEGFGMPVLEAMAAGTPVVTSNTSSLPEVAGDAALLVDPHDARAIARAIKDILRDRSLKDQLVRRGHARAEAFSWEKAAAATAGVIAQAGEGR